MLEEWVSQQTVLDLYRKAQSKRVPFAPVSTMGDLLNSEHLKARGFFVEIAQPVAGTHKYPPAPLRYEPTPSESCRPPPTLGRHNPRRFHVHCARADFRSEQPSPTHVLHPHRTPAPLP